MRPTTRLRRATAAAAALSLLGLPLLGVSAGSAAAAPTAKPKKPAAVKVMTRNLYLGANIMRPINAVRSVPAEPQQTYQYRLIDALANATDTTRDIVDETDFAVRARLLASELVAKKPDLVGLQEVALWRTGPMDDPGGPDLLVPNAETVEYDFLAMLRQELRKQGAPYRAVSVNWLSDVEAPAYQGSIMDPQSLQDPRDVRLTMRDVVLKRVGSPGRVVKTRERHFDAALDLEIAGRTLDFTRGYQWVDLRGPAGRYRFVNSHFEAFSSDIAFAQAGEVMAVAGSAKKATIFVCDCNSDPVDGSIKTDIGDTKRHWAPYWLITGPNGFHDTWLQIKPAEEGWTSGLNERVNAPTADGFDHRIDMVFARTKDGNRVKAVGGDVTGDEVSDRDPDTGLWPSDHAGVFMRLRGLN